MEKQTCAKCHCAKLIILFAPAQRKNHYGVCMACVRERGRQYRHGGSPHGTHWRQSFKEFFVSDREAPKR
jgi:hypothetical protein